jgi:hypothetical protein
LATRFREPTLQRFNVLGRVELLRRGRIVSVPFKIAGVAELADALDSKSERIPRQQTLAWVKTRTRTNVNAHKVSLYRQFRGNVIETHEHKGDFKEW